MLGRQWMWKLRHPEGSARSTSCTCPVGRPVRLTMTSQDVIHSFYIPAFRIKQDVVPGRYTSLWFQPTKPGEYHLFCAEYCGTKHSGMIGWVVVMEPRSTQRWLDERRSVGGRRWRPRASGCSGSYGCSGCHGAERDGPRARCSTGVYGHPVPLADGRSRHAPTRATSATRSCCPESQVVAGLPAGHADLPGPHQRGRAAQAHRLHQVARARMRGPER